ncbi:MAG: hypothetical protein IPQ07_23285 [Myxococcales bacterium]|nr:hypothetical protein [Myxococcales bacterium]
MARTVGFVVSVVVILPAIARYANATDTVGAANLTIVDGGVTQMIVDAAGDDVAVSCFTFSGCEGTGCVPQPALQLSVTSPTSAFTLQVVLPDPAPVGMTFPATAGGLAPIPDHAAIAILTTGAGWQVTSGDVRVDANEFPTIANHLDVTLIGVTDGAGRTIDGTVSCVNMPGTGSGSNPLTNPADPSGDGCSGNGGGGGGGGHH